MIGMVFGSLSLWLWSLAVLALAFMLLRGYFLLSWLWHLPERMPKMRESLTLKHGDSALLQPLLKESMAIRIAKGMIVGALILGAYDVGTQINYSREHAGWERRSAEIQKLNSQWKTDYVAWKQKENKINAQLSSTR